MLCFVKLFVTKDKKVLEFVQKVHNVHVVHQYRADTQVRPYKEMPTKVLGAPGKSLPASPPFSIVNYPFSIMFLIFPKPFSRGFFPANLIALRHHVRSVQSERTLVAEPFFGTV
jgi:hypothetical protein